MIKNIVSMILGFNSGVMYALNVMVYTVYLMDIGANLEVIGALALTTLPYSFKYLWAPIFDQVRLGFFYRFGQRKSWVMFTQIMQVLSILLLSIFANQKDILTICVFSFLTCFCSASFDIVSQSYRIELASLDNKYINFLNIFGFRAGFIISGGGGIALSAYVAWQYVFLITACYCMIPLLIMFFIKDTSKHIISRVKENRILYKIFNLYKRPIFLIMSYKNWLLLMFLIVFFKLSDGYLDRMSIPYFEFLQFSKSQIAYIQSFGVVATLIGTWFGNLALQKFNMLKCLFFSELLSGLTNLLFLFLQYYKSQTLLFTIVFAENIASGMCNISLIYFMTHLCSSKFKSIHFAIFTSISSVSKTFVSSTSGFVVVMNSWSSFLILSSLLSLPALIFILLIYYNNSNLRLKNIS